MENLLCGVLVLFLGREDGHEVEGVVGGGDGVPAVDARREKYRIGPFPLTIQLKEGMQQVE